MNDLANMGQTMTIQQVACALEVPERTVHNAVDRALPGIKRNGMTTYLNPEMVALVMKELKKAHNSDLASSGKVVTTALEMTEKVREVMAWLSSEADRLRAELDAARPKIECANALMRSERTMSITDAAKHFGLHPKTEVFPYLRARGYLTMAGLPTQSAIDAGYLSLKETVDQEGNVWPRSVVEAWQLENWRAHVVHQVKHFCLEARK